MMSQLIEIVLVWIQFTLEFNYAIPYAIPCIVHVSLISPDFLQERASRARAALNWVKSSLM